jgi:hypothetical protein
MTLDVALFCLLCAALSVHAEWLTLWTFLGTLLLGLFAALRSIYWTWRITRFRPIETLNAEMARTRTRRRR